MTPLYEFRKKMRETTGDEAKTLPVVVPETEGLLVITRSGEEAVVNMLTPSLAIGHCPFSGQEFVWMRDGTGNSSGDDIVFATDRPDDAADAKRWRALVNSGRLRLLGRTSFEPDNWAHFGMEFWDRYPDQSDGPTNQHESHKRAVDTLTEYADLLVTNGYHKL